MHSYVMMILYLEFIEINIPVKSVSFCSFLILGCTFGCSDFVSIKLRVFNFVKKTLICQAVLSNQDLRMMILAIIGYDVKYCNAVADWLKQIRVYSAKALAYFLLNAALPNRLGRKRQRVWKIYNCLFKEYLLVFV